MGRTNLVEKEEAVGPPLRSVEGNGLGIWVVDDDEGEEAKSTGEREEDWRLGDTGAEEEAAAVTEMDMATDDADEEAARRSLVEKDYFVLVARFSLSDKERQESEVLYDTRGYGWTLLVYAYGDAVPEDAISVFLKLYSIPPDVPQESMSRTLAFNFALLAPKNMKYSLTRNQETFEFQGEGETRGYRCCFGRKDVTSSRPKDFLDVDGHFMISAVAEDLAPEPLPAVPQYRLVGLRNQGATCYMNSLLQTLFHLRKLRRAVYETPTSAAEGGGVSLALQRTFWKLQRSTSAVGTKELTRSFGWDSYQSFQQQDVQELNRVLCDKLEENMKDSEVAGTIKHLFEGETQSYIECVNVNYRSVRKETFYDIQLDVKGCKDIYESFSKYTEEEIMQGDDMYDAGEHGKQVAKRGTKFSNFPPVLNIHLKRFEYDIKTHDMVKVNDRFEFPFRLDLKDFLQESASEEKGDSGAAAAAAADQTERTGTTEAQESQSRAAPKPPPIYYLHSVLVHSGDVHSGHYYAFVRPSSSRENVNWAKFDDEAVCYVRSQEAIESNYGAGPSPVGAIDPINYWGSGSIVASGACSSFTSAYMLVYVRESELSDVMGDGRGSRAVTGDEGDIPEELNARFVQEEAEEVERKQLQAEAHLYATFRVATFEDVVHSCDYARNDAEFVNWGVARSYRMKKQEPIRNLLQLVSADIGIPVDRVRLWSVINRENRTIRAHSPLEDDESLDRPLIDESSASPDYSNLKFYLESMQDFRPPKSLENDGGSLPPTEGRILLFFKLYDPTVGRVESPVSLLGSRLISEQGSFEDLKDACFELLPPKFRKGAALLPGLELKLYEVIKLDNIPCIEPGRSIQSAELQHGDVVCCQVVQHDEEGENQSQAVATNETDYASAGRFGAREDLEDGNCQQRQSKRRKDDLIRVREKTTGVQRTYAFDPDASMSRLASRAPDPPAYFKREYERMIMHFVPNERRREVGLLLPFGSRTSDGRLGVTIELGKNDPYEYVLAVLAAHLEGSLDPLRLCLSPHSRHGTTSVHKSPLQLMDSKLTLSKLAVFPSSTSTRDYQNRADTLAFDLLPFSGYEWRGKKVVEVECLDKNLRACRLQAESGYLLWRRKRELQRWIEDGGDRDALEDAKLADIDLLRTRVCVAVDANAQVKHVLSALRERLHVPLEIEIHLMQCTRGLVESVYNPREACASLPTTSYETQLYSYVPQGALSVFSLDSESSLLETREETRPLQVVFFSKAVNCGPHYEGFPCITFISRKEGVEELIRRVASKRDDLSVDDLRRMRAAVIPPDFAAPLEYVGERRLQGDGREVEERGDASASFADGCIWDLLDKFSVGPAAAPQSLRAPHEVVWKEAALFGFEISTRSPTTASKSSQYTRRYEGGIKIR